MINDFLFGRRARRRERKNACNQKNDAFFHDYNEFACFNLHGCIQTERPGAPNELRMDDLIDLQSDAYFMNEALRLARKAFAKEEVPVGAVVVRDGKIIGRAHNQVELLKDATAHAEMVAITQAEAAVGDWRLNDCDLYVTKEPCAMCAGALVHVRMRRVIFGCADERSGAAGGTINLLQMPSLNHRCEIVGGVLSDECAELLKGFFQTQRSRISGG